MKELSYDEIMEVSGGKFKLRINLGTFIGGAVLGFITRHTRRVIMRQKLFYLACSFVFMWTLGEVFEAPHRQNVVQALSMTVAYAIYLGLHLIAWNQIKALCSKGLR